MISNSSSRVSLADKKEVEHQLLQGIVSRTSTLCFIWAAVAIVYGLASLDILRLVKPNITMFDNLWPRFLFNSLPACTIGLWYLKYKNNTTIKAYSTAIVLPALLASAASVYAWPLFWQGNYHLYLYFHASNIVAVSTALAISSGTLQIVIAQIIGFFIIFWCPVIYMFSRSLDNELTSRLIVSDFIFVAAIFIPGLYGLNKLRYKLAIADKKVKELTTSFLGSPLTKAIYEDGVEGIVNFSHDGIMLAIDLRGYTSFVHNVESKIVKAFMQKYHTIVSQAVGNNSGYLHKSNGDGHMISFGIMDSNPDISDLPGYEDEIKRSTDMKKAIYFLNSIKTFVHMLMAFEKLKDDYKINRPLLIGAGIAYGSVEVVLRGDKRYRQELDIDGETIVRAVRLESYSKVLNLKVDNDSSFLLISPELSSEVAGVPGVHEWYTTGEGQIRDYPWIEKVYYRQWKHNRKRNTSENAA